MPFRMLTTALLLTASAAAAAQQSFDAAGWLGRFAYEPPSADEQSVGAHAVSPLPSFSVTPSSAGRHLVRVSLPFPPGALADGLTVDVTSNGQTIDPDFRVLTKHPGKPTWIRRGIVTFPFEFSSDKAASFTLSRTTQATDKPASTNNLGGILSLGGVRCRIDQSGASIQWDNGPEWRADVVAPELREAVTRLEIVEEGDYYVWARLLAADAQWPRIIEVKIDALGAVTLQAHVQRLEDGDAYAPELGWRIEGPVAFRPQDHVFDNGEAFESGSPDGAYTVSFPVAPLTLAGSVKAEGNILTYRRSSSGDKVPHQEAAWRRAALVIGPTGYTPRNALLEPDVAYKVDSLHYDRIYESGQAADLALWPELGALRDYTRNAIAASALRGDDYGNVTSFNNGGAASTFGMNRLNHCPPIFEEYYRSDDAVLRKTALLWCNNMHDLSIWWGNDEYFGGTRYNNAVAAGRKEHEGDESYMWRTNTGTSTFCTKGYDSFFYAYEETGDPRMATALRHQVRFASKYVHADTGEARNIGDVADFVRLYRFTGLDEYRDQAFRLFRELRTKLGDDGLFSQSGAPIEKDRPFINDDAFGYDHPFAKPYIIGYGLAGCPWLLEWEPDEPRLAEMIAAVADFMARSQDPAGGWGYPAPESSGIILGQAMEHAAQISRAAAALDAHGEDIAHLLDTIEKVLQVRLNGYLKTGTFVTNLGGWEQSAGILEEGKSIYGLYDKPEDRNRSRDYTEGAIGYGGSSPEGLVYFTEVLDFYMRHRPAERLFNKSGPLEQILARIEPAAPDVAERPAPSDTVETYAVRDRLPIFNARRIANMNFPMAWQNSELPFQTWRQEARTRFFERLGAPPPRGRFDAAMIASEDRGTHTAYKLAFNVNAWERVKAYFLVPKGEGPFPAVLALHDHGAHFSIGKEKVIRPFNEPEERMADAQDWVNKYYGGRWFGDELAARGYAVFSTDALFWGDRGYYGGPEYEVQQALGANMLQIGMSWAGTILYDDLRSAQFLQTRSEVNPARIGAVGLSMGSYRTWNLAAATDIIQCGAAICWMGDTQSLAAPGNNQTTGQSAFSMLQPYIRNDLDYPDVASIACPKPMLFFNGGEDALFPNDGVQRSYEKMKHVWQSQNVPGKLVTKLWPGVPHEFNAAMQEEAFGFLDEHLKP